MAAPLTGDASAFSMLMSHNRVNGKTQNSTASATPVASIRSTNRLAGSIDQVSIKPTKLEIPKGFTTSLNTSLSGTSLGPSKRLTPRATADYSKLGQNLKAQMNQTYPKAAPSLSDAAVPKLEGKRGPIPSATLNTQALHKMRGAVAPDTRAIAGSPEATVSKLRPLRDSLTRNVGQLTPGQGGALMAAGTKTAAAQAQVVRKSMDASKKQMDNSRRKLAVQQENQRENTARVVQRLRVKFDSIPQHLQDFAARAAKEIVVPLGLEKAPLEKMLSGKGVVGFKGPGMAAYEAYMANQ
jgi:hypothetical protein